MSRQRHMTKRDYEDVHPSCGCVFCDLKLPIYRDDQGFYHDGPEDMRITCEAEVLDQ